MPTLRLWSFRGLQQLSSRSLLPGSSVCQNLRRRGGVAVSAPAFQSSIRRDRPCEFISGARTRPATGPFRLPSPRRSSRSFPSPARGASSSRRRAPTTRSTSRRQASPTSMTASTTAPCPAPRMTMRCGCGDWVAGSAPRPRGDRDRFRSSTTGRSRLTDASCRSTRRAASAISPLRESAKAPGSPVWPVGDVVADHPR